MLTGEETTQQLLDSRKTHMVQLNEWKQQHSAQKPLEQLIVAARNSINAIDQALAKKEDKAEWIEIIKEEAKAIAGKEGSFDEDDQAFMKNNAETLIFDIKFKKPENFKKVFNKLSEALKGAPKENPRKKEFEALANIVGLKLKMQGLETNYKNIYSVHSHDAIPEIDSSNAERINEQSELRAKIEENDLVLAEAYNEGFNIYLGKDNKKALFYMEKSAEIKEERFGGDKLSTASISSAEFTKAKTNKTEFLIMASLCAYLGRKEKALSYYEKAIESTPLLSLDNEQAETVVFNQKKPSPALQFMADQRSALRAIVLEKARSVFGKQNLSFEDSAFKAKHPKIFNTLNEKKLAMDLEDKIKIALAVFKKHGRANPSDTRFPSAVPKTPLSPDSLLKEKIEALEQSKYKLPLHCKIREVDGQKVRVVVQAEEGELEGFPISTKASLQIRLLHRSRAAMQLMQQKRVGDSKAAKLEILVNDWVEKWDKKNHPSEGSLKEDAAEFESLLEQMTVFTTEACGSQEEISASIFRENYNGVVSDLDKIEPLLTWQDGRMPNVWFTKGDNNKEFRVQMEDPYRSLTKAQIEEFMQVLNEGSEPFWFKSLPKVQQVYLKQIVEKAKAEVEAGRPNPLENTLPSTLRGIPGSANFSECRSMTVTVGENNKTVKESSVYSTVRAGTADAVNMEKHERKQEIADQNIDQLLTLAQSKAKEYSEFWGVKGSKDHPIQVPLSITSLLSGTRLGENVLDFDMILAKEKAIQKFQEIHSDPINIVTDEIPNYVKFDLLGQNYQLNAMHRVPYLRGDPAELKGKNYDKVLIDNFANHIDQISIASKCQNQRMSTISNTLKGLKEPIANLPTFMRDMKSASLKNVETLKRMIALLEEEGENSAKTYFSERLSSSGLADPDKAEKQAADFMLSLHALTQLIELNREGKGRIQNKEHRNRPLFAASYHNIVIGMMHGVAVSGCKSSNDRRGLERIHTEAMLRVFKRTGRLPRYDDGKDERKIFVDEMVKVTREGLINQGVSDNTPGAFGIKNDKPGGFSFAGLWPKDLEAALKGKGFVEPNKYFGKLNRIAGKLNRFKSVGGGFLFFLKVVFSLGTFLVFTSLSSYYFKNKELNKIRASVGVAADTEIKPQQEATASVEVKETIKDPEKPLEIKLIVEGAAVLEQEEKGQVVTELKVVAEPPVKEQLPAATLADMSEGTFHMQHPQEETPLVISVQALNPKTLQRRLVQGTSNDQSLIEKMQALLANSAFEENPTEIGLARQLTKTYGLKSGTNKGYGNGQGGANKKVSTSQETENSAKAAIYALGVHNLRTGSITIAGGTLEQRVAAFEAARDVGFTQVCCVGLKKEVGNNEALKARLNQLGDNYILEPQSTSAALRWKARPDSDTSPRCRAVSAPVNSPQAQ